MPVQKVNIETFLELARVHPIIDVRSPGEYDHAQIPGAYSLPLFTNEERKVVGTAYKQQSRQKAIKIGLEFFGKKTVAMIEEVERLVESSVKATDNKSGKTKEKAETSEAEDQYSHPKTVLVHCWRGGMRSGAVAWLLDLYGFKVYSLAGGYKGFRQWVLKQFEQEYDFKLLGGYTGSGKTEVLHSLRTKGQNVIDLEDLANHKGSAFGNIGLPPQPLQEMFENKLAIELSKAFNCNTKSAAQFSLQEDPGSYQSISGKSSNNNTEPSSIWLEDESQRIGSCNIPQALWLQVRSKHLYFIDVPFEERLNHIITWYGKGDKEKLINAIVRIKKRLGGLETKTAINHLLEDDVKESFRVLLSYYDKWYLKGLHNRENWENLVTTVECNKVDANGNALKLLETIEAKR